MQATTASQNRGYPKITPKQPYARVTTEKPVIQVVHYKETEQ